MQYNQMDSEKIIPGQEIKLYPYVIENSEELIEFPKQTTILASYREKPIQEYINYKTENKMQLSASYAETKLDDPVLNYKQAIEILHAFDRSIDRERRISNDLAGYCIVLDPGHGGLDPGAIVPSKKADIKGPMV